MDAMILSAQTPDPYTRKALIREAYRWLQRYFDAEDREVARLERLAAR
jgi:hypothetical protein